MGILDPRGEVRAGENEASMCVCVCLSLLYFTSQQFFQVLIVRPVRGSFTLSLNDDGLPAPAHKERL